MTTKIDIEKECIKSFGPLFSQTPKLYTTPDWVDVDIYDIPTQFFVYWETNVAIYSRMGEWVQQVINKIIKENNMLELNKETISLEDITEFRRLFWKHPEIEGMLTTLVTITEIQSSVEWLNIFFNETIRLKVYEDENLAALREFRMYIAQKSIEYQWKISSDMKMDLYYFLEFDRFNSDNWVKKEADKVLNKICSLISSGDCPDLRKFKSYNDWDGVPDTVINMIEMLVLVNYCDKPDPKVVEEVRTAAMKMDFTVLREYLGFTPRGWQRYALIFESRENLAANCRRSGKSFFMVYIAIRQIFLPGQMILYILPNKEDYSEQPFFYLEQMVENIKKLWGELSGFQFNSKTFKVTNKAFKSKIIFLSAQGSSKGKSFSANLVIVDESWYIDDGNIYEQASNSTSDTKGRMRAVSTINVNTPINWFFYKKVSLEGMYDCKVISVDIYNNPFMRQEEKDRVEKKFKNRNEAVWLADWMAIFVGGSEWFDIWAFFKIDFVYDVVTFKGFRFNLARNLDKYTRFIFSYDPAKNLDKAGVSLLGQIGNSAEVIMTGYIEVKNYVLQWECIDDILKYIAKIKPVEYAIDVGKAWEAALDRFEMRGYHPYAILSTGWQNINKVTHRRWNVPEPVLEKNLKAMLSAKVVTGYSWLEYVRNEFETYWLSKDRKWWVNHHHDVLSSLMMGAYIRYKRWLIDFEKVKKTAIEVESKTDAYWRPLKAYKNWSFNPNRQWRFLY